MPLTRRLSRRRVPLLPVLVPLLRRDRDLVLTHHAADPLMRMSAVRIGRRLAQELAKLMSPGRSHSKWGNVMELLEWDAQTYDSLPLPHRRWGSSAIERLTLTGNETVLDLGCGTGRDTETLLDLLPNGRVIAVDGSRQMLDELRTRLAGKLDRVTVVQLDIQERLDLPDLADAAVSVATLHWLPDHAAVFRRVAQVLRPGARFVAEGGGAGNIVAFRKALREVSGADGAEIWNFATVEDTRAHLGAAGFTDIEVHLVADPVQLERGEQLEAFVATVLLGAQLRDMAPEKRRPFVRAVVARLPEPTIDYVRLQIEATRA